MDPSRSEGDTSRPQGEEPYNPTADFEMANEPFCHGEVGEESAELEGETLEGDPEGPWEEGESGEEEEVLPEDLASPQPVSEAGDTAPESEAAAYTREAGDAQERDPEGLTLATTSVRALALRTIRQNDQDTGEIDLSEILSPEEIEFVNNRGGGVAAGTEAGQAEGSPHPENQLRGTEAQASMTQSDSTSPYSSEEITRLSALPEKPDTRFMHVWNMFDREKTGKVWFTHFPTQWELWLVLSVLSM